MTGLFDVLVDPSGSSSGEPATVGGTRVEG
jgi:hypothetical protein